MRVHFKTAAIAKRAASRLKDQLGVKASPAREWTAFVLGYRDWHGLEAALDRDPPSPLDEDLPPEALVRRQQYQIERLSQCLDKAGAIIVAPPRWPCSPREIEALRRTVEGGGVKAAATALGIAPSTVLLHLDSVRSKLGVRSREEAIAYAISLGLLDSALRRPNMPLLVDPAALLARWRPSAARPQEAGVAHASPESSVMPLPEALAALIHLLSPEAGKSVPDLPLPVIENAFEAAVAREARDDVLEMAAVTLPIDYLLASEPARQAAGRRMLQKLVARGNPAAMTNLALCLQRGDGGPKDPARALELFEFVADSPRANAKNRGQAQQALAFALDEGVHRPRDRRQALALWESAAALGNAEGAHAAALFYDERARQCVGVVAPDATKAARYYRQAVAGGLIGAATNLGLHLMLHPKLADGPDEGVRWLRHAAQQGDAKAQRLLSYREEGGVGRAWADLFTGNLDAEERAEVSGMLGDVMDAHAQPPRLSPRELECLQAHRTGQRTPAIASRMGIGPGIVALHFDSARHKLKARSRAEAVAKAVALGLLDPPDAAPA